MAASILIIEDEPDLRSAIERALETLGVQPLVAVDGESGLDLLRRGARPRLILLDLMMPGTDGFKFRAQQMEDPALAGIPVVVMTANFDADVVERRLGLPVLRKPIRYEELAKLVEQFP